MIKYAELNGVLKTSEEFNSTTSTINRLLIYKKELLELSNEEYLKIKNGKKRFRSDEYMKKFRLKHNPKNRRKKNPFLIISRYANSNYKLVCHRTKGMNNLILDESAILKPIDLWRIAKKQKCKCALSDLKLNSETVSVDHIIPISKGGKNSIDNVRLVDGRINKMRNDMNDEEFFKLCQLVSIKNP